MYTISNFNFEKRETTRKKKVFKQLVIPVVPMGQVGAHQGDLVGQALDIVAMRPDQFPDIGILFVRHDTASRGQ